MKSILQSIYSPIASATQSSSKQTIRPRRENAISSSSSLRPPLSKAYFESLPSPTRSDSSTTMISEEDMDFSQSSTSMTSRTSIRSFYSEQTNVDSQADDDKLLMQNTLQQTQVQLAEVTRQLDDIKALYHDQSSHLRNANQTVIAMRKEVSDLQQRCDMYRRGSARLEASALALKSTNGALAKEIRMARGERDAALDRVSELTARIEVYEAATLIVSGELACFKDSSILGLKGDEAKAMCDYLQSRIDSKPSPGNTALLLRFLQDLCSCSGQLPASLWLDGVKVHHWQPINRGGEAIVYNGEFRGRQVAVRTVIQPENADWETHAGQETIKLIRREIVTHRQLKHKNITPILGIFCEDSAQTGPPSIVLPYYHRGSARSWLKFNMNATNYLKILREVVEGLEYLHGCNPPIIHGDLHSGNILIDNNSVAVLCDFGYSRVRHEVSRALSRMQITQNFRFLAPELFIAYITEDGQPREPDHLPNIRSTQQSDIYALGMTFYELGSLRNPFHDVFSPYDAAEKALKGVRPSKLESFGGLKGEEADMVWELVTMMWHQEPQCRPSLHEIRDILE